MHDPLSVAMGLSLQYQGIIPEVLEKGKEWEPIKEMQ
jgi:hypothetical protein